MGDVGETVGETVGDVGDEVEAAVGEVGAEVGALVGPAIDTATVASNQRGIPLDMYKDDISRRNMSTA